MPAKNAAYDTTVSLTSRVNPNIFVVNPTISVGDVKVSTDWAPPANIATLPTVVDAAAPNVKLSLSADEMNGSNIAILFNDAGAIWADLEVNIETTDGDRLNSVFASLAAGVARVDAPIQQGKLSLWIGESRDGVLANALTWNYTTTTDLLAGGTATLTFTEKYCETAVIGSPISGVIANVGGDDYSITFNLPTSVSDAFLAGVRMKYRAVVNHGTSEKVLDGGVVEAA